MVSQSRDRLHRRHTGVHAELCLHVAMRAVTLPLITVSVRNNNGITSVSLSAGGNRGDRISGMSFYRLSWLFLAKETLK